MPTAEPAILLREVRKLAEQSAGPPDRLLLEQFIDRRDEAAFALLVARHGPMVLAVCRAMLGNHHDAEDAFQATFLVLARKADSIRNRDSVGSWLHGVAHQLARNLQARARRRRSHETRTPAMPAADPVLDLTVRELHQAVSDELRELPEPYRDALVACYLEGLTQEAAAQRLGCSKGVLRGRLNRGREALRARLERRGLALSLGALPAGEVPLPQTLADATVRAALGYAAGEQVAGLVSAQSVLLAQGALKALFPTRLGLAVLLLVGLSLLATASAVAPPPAAPPATRARRPAEQPEPGPGPEPVHFDPNPIDLRPVAREAWGVAFSPDGSTVASVCGLADRPGELVLWDAKKGTPRVRVRENRGVRSLAFSPDGRLLATADYVDQTAKVRDAGTGRVLHVLRGHTAGVNGVAFSPDGKTLATAGLDRTVRLWSPRDGRLRATLRGHTEDGVYAVACSADGKWLASCGFDRTARVWDLATGKEQAVLSGHQAPVEHVAFSRDGKALATASWDRTIKLWDPATGRLQATLEGHALPVLCVAFSSDGKLLASGSGKWGDPDIADQPGEVKLWDVARRKELASLRGHGDRVWSVAFARGDKLLASAGWDKTVRLWDVAGRKERRKLHLPEEDGFEPRPVTASAYSPAADLLALAPEDGAVVLLNATSGAVRHTFRDHEDAVVCLAFSPDGRTLAGGSTGNKVRLWDTRTGKALATLAGHRAWVYALAFAPDGATLASGGYDRTIRLWDVRAGKQTRLFEGHKAAVRALAFSPDGQALASAGSDQRIILWDPAGKKPPVTLGNHEGVVRALAFGPNAKLLASAGEDGKARLWDLAKAKERATLALPGKAAPGELTALAFAPRGGLLVTGGADGVRLWDAASGANLGALRGRGAVAGLDFAREGRRLIVAGKDGLARAWPAVLGRAQQARATLPAGQPGWAVAFAPDGRTLASVSGGDESGVLRLWNVATSKERVVRDEAAGLRCVAFSRDGTCLATGGFDNTAQLRDPRTGTTRRVLRGHSKGVNSLAFRPDGKLLLTGSLDGTARLWDVATGKALATLEGHTGSVFCVAFSPDGRTAATAGTDGAIKLWDVAGRKEKLTLRGHAEAIEQVAFSPDGKTLASASWDHTIRLWDVATGSPRRVLRGQASKVLTLAFSPDGRTLATGNGIFYEDVAGEVRLWDLASGRTVRFLRGHAHGVRCVCFSRDGRALASIGEGGAVKLWSLAPRAGR
jgi:RNA polymerase sigma factor (sigma-70 family)